MKILKRLNVFFDADFSKYDKKLTTVQYGMSLIYHLFKLIPYFIKYPHELFRVKRLCQGYSQWILITACDIILMHLAQPSGVLGTTPLNSIHELIIEIVMFHYLRHLHINKEIPRFGNFVSRSQREEDFFLKVALINLGDDNLKAIAECVRKYYTDHHIKIFAQFLKMDITPAAKEEKVMDFKKVDEIIFLKRTPRFIPSLNRYMGALNLTSIYKSLCWTDSSVPGWEQMVLDQAKRELSIHPPEEYKKFCMAFGFTDDQETIQREILNYSWNKAIDLPCLTGDSIYTISQPVPAVIKQFDSTFTCQLSGML